MGDVTLEFISRKIDSKFDAVIATVAKESADIHHRLDMLQTSVNEIAALRASQRADVEVMRSANGGAASE
jgi:hypothetical protein